MKLSYEEFINELGSDNCVVDFWADWCAPCKVFGPVFDSAGKTFDDVKFLKIDVMENPDLATAVGVTSIPCIQFYYNGILIDEALGALSTQEFDEFIKNNK